MASRAQHAGSRGYVQLRRAGRQPSAISDNQTDHQAQLPASHSVPCTEAGVGSSTVGANTAARGKAAVVSVCDNSNASESGNSDSDCSSSFSSGSSASESDDGNLADEASSGRPRPDASQLDHEPEADGEDESSRGAGTRRDLEDAAASLAAQPADASHLAGQPLHPCLLLPIPQTSPLQSS